MTLLLTAGGALLALAVLATGSLWRSLARRDHRCVVGRLRDCPECVRVLPGGHVLCACTAASPHLYGTALLAWRAEHQGERFPGTSTTAPAPASAAEVDDEDTLAAIEAEDEGMRRAVVRARRAPDPRTPQVLREAARPRDTTDVNES